MIKVRQISIKKLEEMFKKARTNCGSWYTDYQQKYQKIK